MLGFCPPLSGSHTFIPLCVRSPSYIPGMGEEIPTALQLPFGAP